MTPNAQERIASKDDRERPRLLAIERRRAVLDIINREGRITISQLTKRFSVSAVTARVDLAWLTKRGRVVRSHGGAARLGEPGLDAPLEIKAPLHRTEKVRIGKAAAALIRSGQTILLDSGTTTLEVARAIDQSGLEVTVITHALNIAGELSHSPQITLMMIGGELRRISQSFVGPQAHNMLAKWHVDHFFLAVDGFDLEGGPSTPDILEAELDAAMIRIAKTTTVVADSSKIGRRSLTVIAPITSVHRLVTDSGLTAEQRAALESKGIEVLVV